MTFECKNNCGNCCGVVPIPKEVYEKNKDKITKKIIDIKQIRDNIYVITKDMFCIFLDKKKRCMIYEERPDVCKIYGIDMRLPCPYFKFDGTKRDRLNQITTQIKIDKDIDNKIKMLNNEFKNGN